MFAGVLAGLIIAAVVLTVGTLIGLGLMVLKRHIDKRWRR